MGAFNGFLSSLIKGSSTGGEDAVLTGISRTTISDAVPMKMFTGAMFGVQTHGISGTYSVTVVGSVGGCTAIFAEADVTADGSTILGTTSALTAIPRPSAIGFSSTTASSGFTASVFMMGGYD